jgi:predicted MPP superfamily phosphohydrolase
MPHERPRLFGRALHFPARKRLMEVVYAVAYAGGWPSALALPLGLQGRLGVATHALRVRAGPAGRDARAPIRIAFASDFHAGPSTHPALVRQACEALAAMRPDLLLLAGDFVAFHARHVARLAPMLAAIEAPLGRFAVPGNHDLMADDAWVVRRLADAGVTTLVNANVRLPAPYDDVWVCGLDDQNQGAPDGAAALAGADGTRLVLMHSPEGVRWLGGEEFAVGFCGHVHGGQFWLGGRARTGHKGTFNQRYLRGGLFPPAPEHAGSLLVSRGIGQTSLPLRRHADPQVHLLTLELSSGA